jgi:parvulin-like peptidyl-prolyl isomerase
VDEILLVQHGRELGVQFTDAKFKEGIEGIKKENNLDEEQFKQALKQEGLTLDELRKNFERAFMVQTVQAQEIFPRMRLTEEELRQYYATHRADFMTPETVTLREIAILLPAPPPGQDAMATPEAAAAKARIEAIRQRVAGGEDFAALVKEASDAATKANGGLIGPVNARDLNPAAKAVLDALKPGDVSPIIQLPRGYQLLKLEARETAEQQPFVKVRERIEVAIRNERLGGEMAKLRARLRSEAVIEWKDDYLRKIYEKRIGERAANVP